MKSLLERSEICGVYNAANDILTLLRNPGISDNEAMQSIREKAWEIDSILSSAMARAKDEGRHGAGQQG